MELTTREKELINNAIKYYGGNIAMGQSGGDEILPELSIILEKLRKMENENE